MSHGPLCVYLSDELTAALRASAKAHGVKVSHLVEEVFSHVSAHKVGSLILMRRYTELLETMQETTEGAEP